MILGTNGEKMSKSRGNVINPDDVVKEIGADSFRLYEMFMGAFDQAIPWSTNGARGCKRFLDRVWRLQDMMTEEKGYSDDLMSDMHADLHQGQRHPRRAGNAAGAAQPRCTAHHRGDVAEHRA